MDDFALGLGIFLLISAIWAFVLLRGINILNNSKVRVSGGVFLFLFLVIIGVAALAIGGFLDHYSEPEFCGSTCHLMEPFYESYLNPENNTIMQTHLEHDVTCVDCHTGPGLSGQIDPFLWAPRQFWKTVTGDYDPADLHGYVPTENCMKGCHDHMDWQIIAPVERGSNFTVEDGSTVWPTRLIWHPFTQNGTDFTELRARDTCIDCHDQRLIGIGFTSQACPTCHDLSIEEQNLHRDQTCGMAHCHRDPEFIAHREVMGKCLDCHDEDIHSDPTCAMDQCHEGPEDFAGHSRAKDNCMFCHNRQHPEDARVPYLSYEEHGLFEVNSTFCSVCHMPQYQTLIDSVSKHNTDTGCPDCHLEHKLHPGCDDCHNGANVDHPLTPPDDYCVRCHKYGGHDPIDIMFPVGQVENDFCSYCHESEYLAFIGSTSEHTENFDCIECHESHRQKLMCLTCHSETDVIHLINPPYDDCTICHTAGAHDPLENIDKNICANCHEEKVNEFETGIHSFAECVDCHGEHGTISVAFELCGSCHTPLPSHDRTTTNCQACHDISRIHPGSTGSTIQPGDEPCSTCHPDQANRLGTGLHSTRDCTSCHGEHGFVQVNFNDCLACHTPPAWHDATTTGCNGCHDTTLVHALP